MPTYTTDESASGQVMLTGSNSNDTINAYDYDGIRQTHVYARDGDDTINMYFGAGNVYRSHWQSQHKEYQGHHVRGGAGIDVFNFAGSNNSGGLNTVTGTVIGRIEDFDYSRDKLQIQGSELSKPDLERGYGTTSGYQWKIVEWNGDHNDANSTPQQWLLIDTGQGWIFYSLEGARVDSNGNGAANSGEQEGHFFTNAPPNFASMPSVGYVDPVNVVPAGQSSSGMTYNDNDAFAADATDVIQHGSVMNTHNTHNDGSPDTSDDVTLDLTGNDLIAAGLNNDTVYAGSGNDRVWGGSGNDLILGQDGNDTLYGNTGDDSMDGGNAWDQLYGGTGNDTLRGGYEGTHADRDHLYGGAGDDIIFASTNSGVSTRIAYGDRLHGEDGDDILHGGNSNDMLWGGDDDDLLNGNGGADQLWGGSGTDTLTGGGGADTLSGEAGNDSILGGDDGDVIYGGAGNDVIHGQNGNDTIRGEGGNDTLSGNAGDDYLIGGGGADVFVFGQYAGSDTISGFDSSDQIDLSSYAGQHTTTYSGTTVIIELASGDELTIWGYDRASLGNIEDHFL